MKKTIKKGLYFITDRNGYSEEEFLQVLEQVCSEGISLLQLREKNLIHDDFLKLAKKVKKIADKYQVDLIIDDNVDIAKEISCGVHLGVDDMSIAKAREILGEDVIIGATAKSLDRAMESQKQGADYLGVGAIYPTKTHVKTKITPVETLDEIIAGVDIPVFAIGGLREDNLEVLKDSNINGICIVSRIMQAEDPKKQTRIVKEALGKIINIDR